MDSGTRILAGFGLLAAWLSKKKLSALMKDHVDPRARVLKT